MLKRDKISITLLLLIGLLQLLITLYSCGFAYKKHIVGKYHLIAVDTRTDISLCYEISSGDCIGRVPARVIEYGYSDSLLVAKAKEYGKASPSFYIIDMRKDSDYAHEEQFRIGPLTESEFDEYWRNKLKIQMNKVK